MLRTSSDSRGPRHEPAAACRSEPVRRPGRAAVLEGRDGPRADRDGRPRGARLRARLPRRAGPAHPRRVLGQQDGRQAVERLVRYNDLRALELPIIVLVGGATGTGKSTVATEVAHRL